MLEDVVVSVLEDYNIIGMKDKNAMGVWIDADNPDKARKMCSIGVKASRYVTMHGLALNVNTDLSYFSYINPCGFTDRPVTSINKEIGRDIDMQEVSAKMKDKFEEIFEFRFR